MEYIFFFLNALYFFGVNNMILNGLIWINME